MLEIIRNYKIGYQRYRPIKIKVSNKVQFFETPYIGYHQDQHYTATVLSTTIWHNSLEVKHKNCSRQEEIMKIGTKMHSGTEK